MTENVKKFLEFVSQNEAAKKELEAGRVNLKGDENASIEAFIKFADKYGFTLTYEDLKPEEGELSEDELKAVAGGGGCENDSFCGDPSFIGDLNSCFLSNILC
ncbi:MAG: Nif11 family protein [Synergistaceae bacterium]|nr:Nif11 family protein [Synergistaceae bacterium]